MPNGAYAVATATVNAGLASRIADYNDTTNYPNTPRSQRHLAGSMARVFSGQQEQRDRTSTPGMRAIPGRSSRPKGARVIPPGGAVHVGGKGRQSGAFRRKAAKAVGSVSGVNRKAWRAHKPPSESAIKKGVKNGGFYSVKPKKS